MEKKVISTKKAPAAVGPYVQAVQKGNMLYASGQLGLIPETGELPKGVEAQTSQSLKNVQAILDEAGFAKEDIVKTTVFITDMEDFAAVKGVFEGLYIGTPSTYILTHTSQGAIGMTTRKGDSLDEFRDTILAKPHVCECLRKTIDDIGRILGEMADGNIAVDVQ